jgi:hypothetical protein
VRDERRLGPVVLDLGPEDAGDSLDLSFDLHASGGSVPIPGVDVNAVRGVP